MARQDVKSEKGIIQGELRRQLSVVNLRASMSCMLDRLHQSGEGGRLRNRRQEWRVREEERMREERVSRQLSDIICQLGQLSARTTVSSDICQLGHLSARTTVRPDNCKVSNCQNPMDNCQIKLSELWKNCQSYGKTVSSDSCPLKTVRPDSCLPIFILLGFWWDDHSRPQMCWDRSQLLPSQTPTNHPSLFV